VGGAPRRSYASWQALFNSAEENKGYALGKALIEAARAERAIARDGAIHVVGLGGDPSWFGSGLRQAGLARAVAEQPGVVLEQVVPTKWTAAEGKALTPKLLRRYPQATVIWAASDQLGAGVVEALLALGHIPSEDVFTGGLDLSDLGLSLVEQGKFVATAASPMLSYAEAAVLIYDYLQGLDFADQLGAEIEFQTQVATSANVAEHIRLSKCVGSIDFRRFSRAYTPALRRYDFSSAAYLQAARACIEQDVAPAPPLATRRLP
jgi:ABC-type sugar transport system substrate-binding protein